MQYHPKNSSILYFHFDFSFFLCSSQLDDSALCRHWVFSPQSTLAVKRSSSGNVCCNELQCVTIGHNILQCVTLCCYNRSQCTYRIHRKFAPFFAQIFAKKFVKCKNLHKKLRKHLRHDYFLAFICANICTNFWVSKIFAQIFAQLFA